MEKVNDFQSSEYWGKFNRPKSSFEKKIFFVQQFVDSLTRHRTKKEENKKAYKDIEETRIKEAMILNEVYDFSLGTINYQVIEDNQVERQYIPIFPDFYKPHGFTKERIKDVQFKFKLQEDRFKNLTVEGLKYKNLQVSFTHLADDNKSTQYSLDIKIDQVSKISGCYIDNDVVQLILTLKKPCRVFAKLPKIDLRDSKWKEVNSPFTFLQQDKQFMTYWNLKQVIFLQGKFDLAMNLDELQTKFKDLDRGTKLNFQNNFDMRVLQDMNLYLEHEKLLQRNQQFFELIKQLIIPAKFGIMSILSTQKTSIFSDHLNQLMENLLNRKFNGEYLFKASEDEFTLDYFIQPGNIQAHKEVRKVLYIMDQICNSVKHFEKNSDSLQKDIEEEYQDQNDLKQRRVYQTPTLTLFHQNYKEQTHRVLRYNHLYKDFFFRLILVNDDGEKTHFGNFKGKPVLEKMKDIMKDQFYIGGTKGQVLNYSNSQLKNHSVWMLCDTNIPDIIKERIIYQLGTFSKDEGYLKMFARIGQCFSTTKYVCRLNEKENVRYIDDLKVKKTDDNEDKNGFYCYTDGCGNISESLCNKIAESHNLEKCSAFQIRLGGIKGVLMKKIYSMQDGGIYVDEKNKLQGDMVEIRPSQIKFKCDQWDLEVIRCATFSQGYLNRQVILLLNCLGVPEDIFISLQKQQLENLDVNKVMEDLHRRSHVFLMNRRKVKSSSKQSQELSQEIDLFFGPSRVFSAVFKNALLKSVTQYHKFKEENKDDNLNFDRKVFRMEKEPIFQAILQNMVLGLAVNLKKKARIRIKNSCVLIGVIDETGSLNDGEIFVKINRSSYDLDNAQDIISEELDKNYDNMTKNTNAQVIFTYEDQQISGKVIVTKNPCSHPGDIRLLTAIGPEDERCQVFEELINVIVFPSKGYRPEQHKMSGGDLDGDVYMCIWDDQIVSQIPESCCKTGQCTRQEGIQPPAVYKKFEEDSNVNSDNIVDHMANYFERDNLGHLAHLHLGLCDQEGVKGPFRQEMIELSWYMSIAVDFAKHGKSVEPHKYQHIERKLNQWPDFMEKHDQFRKTVQSPLVLGKLYRAVNCKSFYRKLMEYDYEMSILLKYELNETIIKKREEDQKTYSRDFINYLIPAFDRIVVPLKEKLRDLMVMYNIAHESELFCTNLTFSLNDENMDKIVGDPGQKDEDAVRALNHRLQEYLTQYKNEFQKCIKDLECVPGIFAKAVYYATYYNEDNIPYQQFSTAQIWAKSDKTTQNLKDLLIRFEEHWKAHISQEMSSRHLKMQEAIKDFSHYKKVLEKDTKSSKDKLRLLLEVRQFFSIPWIICHEYLID
ncbi:rna-directed rna polymerase [Stylonychia lemnae]|uniref:RNA-dependent RNA polymerase n=1 Tax=Stylonychia lemnae TaxID=5949 RepID=A0A077ZX89_STYLE|nr:rna-directed rna polymerase [Stylonychia lemnae]|eukprot:CDW74505.1 rna-directed rna polymerase [Stylonychia lemnae]